MNTYGNTVHTVLSRQYAPLRNASKLLARDAGVSPKTAKNWLLGICAPRGDELISLMAGNDTLKEEILNLVEQRRAG